MDITQEMIDKAGSEEGELLGSSLQVLAAQNRHLHNRVVLLRALANEQEKEIEKLRKRKAPQDRRRPAKKAVATPEK